MVRVEGYYFFILWKNKFDEVAFCFIRDFFAPQPALFYYFMTFLRDADGHLEYRPRN